MKVFCVIDVNKPVLPFFLTFCGKCPLCEFNIDFTRNLYAHLVFTSKYDLKTICVVMNEACLRYLKINCHSMLKYLMNFTVSAKKTYFLAQVLKRLLINQQTVFSGRNDMLKFLQIHVPL
jgi:hypothetical protein